MKKKIFLFAAISPLCLLMNMNYGQTPDWIWAKSAEGTWMDIVNCIVSDANCNIYATGFFELDTLKIGDFYLPNEGGADIFIAKYDSSGNALWAKRAGGVYHDKGNSITSDDIGNTYITGFFQSDSITFDSSVLINPNSSESSAIFIVKYDPLGKVLWAKAIGGGSSDEGASLTLDDLGYLYITGIFQSPTINFGSTTLMNSGGGGTDIFLAKFDPSGNVVWAKSATGSGYGWEFVSCVTSSVGCNLYLTGAFDGAFLTFGGYTLPNAGSADLYITKYDSSGNVLWAKVAGGNNGEGGYCLSTDSTDNVYLTGTFASSSINFGDITLTNSYQGENIEEDFFIAKFDGSGNVKWAKSAGEPNHDYGFGITTDPQNNVYVSGQFAGPDIIFDNDTLIGFWDFFLVKYDSLGNVLWAKSAGSNDSETGKTVTSDLFGNIYLAGRFDSPEITIGNTILYNTGMNNTSEIFLAKIGEDINTRIQNPENYYENSIIIFPNPSNDKIIIESTTINKNETIFIYNIQGKILLQRPIEVAKIEIDISNLAKGMYFLRMESEKGVKVRKVMKQ